VNLWLKKSKQNFNELNLKEIKLAKMANKDLLAKGIKYLSGALPLMFIGPSVIYNAFMNQKNDWHYLVLSIGIIACLSAMYLMFVGLKTIMKGIFND
jgi:hypothetical protein